MISRQEFTARQIAIENWRDAETREKLGVGPLVETHQYEKVSGCYASSPNSWQACFPIVPKNGFKNIIIKKCFKMTI